ncbi:hypothetical protein CABS01_07766 [Colletotrichum abscissum]|uniref:Cell wall protein n=4 Tax=Colletotrichum acutatum species complex TaxID=2707335 RepID=A0A9P9XPI6_9PEZI|nr:uncharacterized protein CLUP02_14212 [Colletotrichum lupini]XP_060306727.1 uncharacterized protein CCOS01_14753 [Colletotrichum costaricense]XP_060373498.1 uncharacterized protein CTAM01_15934 [Colletotrichum tamarilloi]XP_060402628.1 uncharacterized protein CABS01_07766 [Colletotrichum abscissum]KAI3527214.1 hypothetical protein CSPX01_17144 [Colletotrichum filicis]KAI3557830.1 hypothetical protein CABS02_02012 [Colletotrichum abscissum]KAK1474353.1 hypothetical protein CTAM01_15934 [Coll
MRAFFVVGSLVLSTVAAAPANDVQKRDLQTIQGAFVSISVASSNLDTAIRALTPDPNSASALGPAMMGLEGALAQARTDVAPTSPIGISDGIALQNAADTLTKSVKIMVMSAMLQRQTLDQINMTPMLLQSFMNQNMLSAALGQVVLSKLPAEGLQSAMAAFAGAGGSVGMGIVSLANPPLAMPPGMGPPMGGAPPAAMPATGAPQTGSPQTGSPGNSSQSGQRGSPQMSSPQTGSQPAGGSQGQAGSAASSVSVSQALEGNVVALS